MLLNSYSLLLTTTRQSTILLNFKAQPSNMLISLRSDHKEHVSILLEQSTQVLVDFCKLSIDFLQNGPNLKLYSAAANKMNIDAEAVQNCVYGLLNLLVLSCKNKLSDSDFRDTVLTIGFANEQQIVLSKFYASKKSDICTILQKLSVKEPHYFNLEWRFEVQVASRALLHQVNPFLTLDLHLKTRNIDKDVDTNILLQTDPCTLLKITGELEKALVESQSRYSRRIQQAFIENKKTIT